MDFAELLNSKEVLSALIGSLSGGLVSFLISLSVLRLDHKKSERIFLSEKANELNTEMMSVQFLLSPVSPRMFKNGTKLLSDEFYRYLNENKYTLHVRLERIRFIYFTFLFRRSYRLFDSKKLRYLDFSSMFLLEHKLYAASDTMDSSLPHELMNELMMNQRELQDFTAWHVFKKGIPARTPNIRRERP